MKVSRRLLLVCLFLNALAVPTPAQRVTTTPVRPSAAPPGTAGKPREGSVLFLGNSLTFFNDLPGMMDSMFKSQRMNIVVDQHTPPARDLGYHVGAPEVARKLAARKWDYVVLQDQSALPAMQPQSTIEHGKKLSEMAVKAGAKPVYFLTWAYPARDGNGMNAEMQKGLNAAYVSAARASENALLAPVGPAWMTALEKDPKLPLYRQGDYHPAPEGTYLTACVLYAVMTHRSPVGLPPQLISVKGENKQRVMHANLTPERAKFYQEIAWETVQKVTMEKLAEDMEAPGAPEETPVEPEPAEAGATR